MLQMSQGLTLVGEESILCQRPPFLGTGLQHLTVPSLPPGMPCWAEPCCQTFAIFATALAAFPVEKTHPGLFPGSPEAASWWVCDLLPTEL